MVYKIIFKRRFQSKLEKLLVYIEQEFGLLVAKKFAGELENKLNTIQRYPFIGNNHPPIKTLEVFSSEITIDFITELKRTNSSY